MHALAADGLSCLLALDTEGLVLHSSSAVAGLLRYWDDRSLRRMIEATTGHKLLESASLSCAVSEHAFRRFPNKSNEEPWRLRLDNVNACLRTFAVDGKSTKMCSSGHTCKDEKLLRSALKQFVFMSDKCFGDVDVASFRHRLCYRRTAALTDGLFVDQVWYAAWYTPSRAPHGMRVHETSNVLEISLQVSTRAAMVIMILLLFS